MTASTADDIVYNVDAIFSIRHVRRFPGVISAEISSKVDAKQTSDLPQFQQK